MKQYRSQAFGYDMQSCIRQAVESLLTGMGRDGVLVIDGTITVRFSDGQAIAWFEADD